MCIFRFLTSSTTALFTLIASTCIIAVPTPSSSKHGVSGHKVNIAVNADESACNHWVDSVYNSLSPRRRVAQLFFPKVVPTRGDVSRAMLRSLVKDNEVGGLIFTEGFIAQYADMTNYAQAQARVPLLMTFDGEWGLRMRIPKTPRFPHNMALGAIHNGESLMYEYGREMARECRIMGIHVNFAPVADVNSNPDNPVISYRSFGEDPQKVASLVCAYSRGLEDGGVQAVAKHFPGHGDTNSDSHKTLPTLTRTKHQMEQVELVPFRRFIAEGHSGIMTAHLAVPAYDKSGTPASLSRTITTGLLRNTLGFDGLIYTDALGMKGATEAVANPCVAALRAGADVLLCPPNAAKDIDAVMAAINSGTISADEVETHCRRILRYKYYLGLANYKPIDHNRLSERINSVGAADLLRRLAEGAITVIRNEHEVLPLRHLRKKDIAIVSIGAEASNDFSNTCRRYAPVDFYTARAVSFSAADIKEICKHNTVIVGVFNDKGSSRQALSALSKAVKAKGTGKVSLVEVFFVNPYKMSRLKGGTLGHEQALVLAYDDTPELRRAAAEAVFGGIEVSGTLPVNLHGIAKIGTGHRLHKTRLGYSSPQAHGMSAALTDSIDAIVNDALAAGAFPGCQVLIGRGGDIVVDRSYGCLTAGGEKVTPFTMYDLASVSKAMGTLPGIMAAVDHRKIDVDAKASQYIPALAARSDGKQDITIRQLLYHESGMPAALNMFDMMMDTATYARPLLVHRRDSAHTIQVQRGLYGATSAKLRQDITSPVRTARLDIAAADGIYVGQCTYDSVMQRIYDIPLRAFKRYNYSCLNFALLMDAEQRATATPHQQWCRTHLWTPLGMTTMCYRPLNEHPRTQIAPTEKDTYLRRQTVWGYVHDEMADFSGGVQGNAGLFANADDLAKMCQMWLNGGVYGGDRILSERVVKLFTTDQSTTCRRGLGFDKPDTTNPDNSPTCDEATAETFGHLGFTGTVFWVDPANDMFFIFLCNRVNPTRDNDAFNACGIRPRLFSQVYQAIRNFNNTSVQE